MCRRSRVSQQYRILAWFARSRSHGDIKANQMSKEVVKLAWRVVDSHSAAFQTDVYVTDDKILITRTGEYRLCGKKWGERNMQKIVPRSPFAFAKSKHIEIRTTYFLSPPQSFRYWIFNFMTDFYTYADFSHLRLFMSRKRVWAIVKSLIGRLLSAYYSHNWFEQ